MKQNIFKEKLFWTILICLLIGFIFFELFRDSFERVGNVINLLNTMASCLTFGLAYLLFDKYGIKKSVVEKQFNAVIDVIQELKKIRILFSVEKVEDGIKQSNEFGQLWIQRDMSVYRKNKIFDKSNLPVLLNYDDFYKGTVELSKSLANIWLPLEIKMKFNFFSIPFFTKPSNLNKIDTVTIAFGTGVIGADLNLEFYFSGTQLTFGSLVNNLEAGIIECENWIKKNAEHDFDMNI